MPVMPTPCFFLIHMQCHAQGSTSDWGLLYGLTLGLRTVYSEYALVNPKKTLKVNPVFKLSLLSVR